MGNTNGPPRQTLTGFSTAPRQAALFEPHLEREFLAWIETPDGRRVEAECTKRALGLVAIGLTHYGIAALFESIRYDWTVGKLGDEEYRLNNNRRALLARRIMFRNQAALGDFFETRELRR